METTKKALGIGSLSLLLDLLALIWSVSVGDRCIGDRILQAVSLPAWSNGIQGTHYTVFYALALLLPAILLGARYEGHLFAGFGKKIALVLTAVLALCGLLIVV